MTLIADLESLDLSGIINARASIRVSVSGPDLQAVLQGGAAQAALAGLGTSLATLRADFQNPAALLRPLMEAVSRVGGLDIAGVPVGAYIMAVREGADIMAGLFRGLGADPEVLGRLLPISLDDAFDRARSVAGGFASVGLTDLGRFRSVIETVERGLPTDPRAFTDMVLGLLLPFPRAALTTMRDGLSGIHVGMGAITLPQGRTSGLVAALDGVARAASAGPEALERALQNLAEVRAHTLSVLRGELLAVVEKIDRLRLDRLLAPVVETSASLRTAREGILEFLENWRAQFASARARVEAFDPAEVIPILRRLIQMVEDRARREISGRVDEQVRRLEAWVRGLLAHLPLRDLRNQVTSFFHDAAQAIEDAELDRFVEAVRDGLTRVEAALDLTALTQDVQAALNTARQAITDTLGRVVAALQAVAAEVNAVAGEAEGILDRLAAALADFKRAMDAVTAAVDGLGVEEAASQVVQTLTTLRETAERVLTVAPLPEPMRPLVQQLIDTLQGVDLHAAFQPVRDAAAQFRIPDEETQSITQALQAARRAVENLIPGELVASIEAEVNQAMQVIRGFDPSTLLGGVRTYLDEAADFIQGLDPRPHVGEIAAPFRAVLDAIDAAHPRRLLAPVIEAYDSLVGALPLPPPEVTVRRSVEAVSAAGSRMAQAVAEPLRQAAPPGTVEVPATPEATAPPPEAPAIAGVRPGDIIRFFGYLPAKLREALHTMEAGPAGEVLRGINDHCRGLASDLRELQGVLAGLEARLQQEMEDLLVPVGAAQLRAQGALQASVSVGGVQVNVALGAVAETGPGSLRAALAEPRSVVAARARQAAGRTGGGVGSALAQAADLLERCRLSNLTGGLDGLLAALDPEPVAAEFDALVAAILRRMPGLLTQVRAEVEAIWQRIQALIAEFNPGMQAQKFLVVLNVLREELELLDPRRLADELGEIHAAIRSAIAAYDPAALAAEVAETLAGIAGRLRALDPAALLGDLSFLDGILAEVQAASPVTALAGVGASLAEVGQRLTEADPAALLDAVERLGPRVVDEFEAAVEAIRREIVALLEALRYATASVSVEAEVEVG